MKRGQVYRFINLMIGCLLIIWSSHAQTTPAIDPMEDVAACSFYVLPDIGGTGLSGSEAYFSGPSGTGQSFLSGDTLFNSINMFVFDQGGGDSDEECFTIQIFTQIDIGQDTTINDCDEYILPPVIGGIPNLDIKTGYYSLPDQQGNFFSEGTRILNSMILYASTGIDECKTQRVLDINIGSSTIFFDIGEYHCPAMSIAGKIRVLPFFVDPDDINSDINPDSLWVTDVHGNLYTNDDSLKTSGTYTVFSDFGGCITSDEFTIEILPSISVELIDDIVVCGDSVFLENAPLDFVGRTYYQDVINPFTSRFPGFVKSPRYETLEYFVIDRFDKCSDTSFFGVNFLKDARSTSSYTQQICSGTRYPLRFMATHESIDFIVEPDIDLIIPVGPNPYVMDGAFNTENIPLGFYDFLIVSIASSDCSPSSDTTFITLEVVDDCDHDDVVLSLCPNFAAAEYFPEILGGSLYDANFNLISNFFTFFERIQDFEFEVNDAGFVYHIITNQLGISDTSQVSLEIQATQVEVNVDQTELCHHECIEVEASVPRGDLRSISLFSINRNALYAVFNVLDSISQDHLLTICYDIDRGRDQPNLIDNIDTLFLDLPLTAHQFDIFVSGDSFSCISGGVILIIDSKDDGVNTINSTLCASESLTIEGQRFDINNPSGQILLPGMSQGGCDSIININIEIDMSSSITLNNMYERDDTVFVNCMPYYKGNETDIITIPGGSGQCDSMIFINFTFESALFESFFHDSICLRQAVIYHGISYDTIGMFLDTIRDALDNDSIIVSVEILGLYDCVLVEDCNNGVDDDTDGLIDYHDPDCICAGQILTDIMIEIDHLSCDQDMILTLTSSPLMIYQWYKDSVPITDADGSTYIIDSMSDDKEGVYQLYAEEGIDCGFSNQVRIDLPGGIFQDTILLCKDDTLQFGDTLITALGDYTQVFSSTIGLCDSTVMLHVEIDTGIRIVTNATLCEGEIFYWNGRDIDSSGFYIDTIFTTEGCDTLLGLIINFNPLPILSTSATICEGLPFVISSDTVYFSGIYEDTLASSEPFECDTILLIDLEVIPAPKGDTMQVDLLAGNQFNFRDQSYSEAGIYTYTTPSDEACDSLFFIEINIVNENSPLIFYVPNIFSPNGDGINDHYEVTRGGQLNVNIEEIMIYNRWGNLLWTYQSNVSEYWDGTIDGFDVASGVYISMIKLRRLDGVIEVFYRDLTLVR